jgi:hypothetical protein
MVLTSLVFSAAVDTTGRPLYAAAAPQNANGLSHSRIDFTAQ